MLKNGGRSGSPSEPGFFFSLPSENFHRNNTVDRIRYTPPPITRSNNEWNKMIFNIIENCQWKYSINPSFTDVFYFSNKISFSCKNHNITIYIFSRNVKLILHDSRIDDNNFPRKMDTTSIVVYPRRMPFPFRAAHSLAAN